MDLSHMVFDNSHIRHTETVHSFIPPPTNRDRVKQRLSL